MIFGQFLRFLVVKTREYKLYNIHYRIQHTTLHTTLLQHVVPLCCCCVVFRLKKVMLYMLYVVQCWYLTVLSPCMVNRPTPIPLGRGATGRTGQRAIANPI